MKHWPVDSLHKACRNVHLAIGARRPSWTSTVSALYELKSELHRSGAPAHAVSGLTEVVAHVPRSVREHPGMYRAIGAHLRVLQLAPDQCLQSWHQRMANRFAAQDTQAAQMMSSYPESDTGMWGNSGYVSVQKVLNAVPTSARSLSTRIMRGAHCDTRERTIIKCFRSHPKDDFWCPLGGFFEELRFLSMLSETIAPQVHRVGWCAGQSIYWISMSALVGGDAVYHYAMFPMSYRKQLGRTMIKRIASLHARGIVHRDVKLNNMAFRDTRLDVENLRVIDFSLSLVLSEVKKKQLLGRVGTEGYLPKDTSSPLLNTPRQDVRALGICLWFLMLGMRPTNDPQDFHVTSDLLKHHVPQDIAPVIERALGLGADAMYHDAQEMLRDYDARVASS